MRKIEKEKKRKQEKRRSEKLERIKEKETDRQRAVNSSVNTARDYSSPFRRAAPPRAGLQYPDKNESRGLRDAVFFFLFLKPPPSDKQMTKYAQALNLAVFRHLFV